MMSFVLILQNLTHLHHISFGQGPDAVPGRVVVRKVYRAGGSTAVKAASRRLRRWPSASLDRRRRRDLLEGVGSGGMTAFVSPEE
jgi:hypothetical protein